MNTNANGNVILSTRGNLAGAPIKLSNSSVAPDVAIQIGETVYHLHAIELRNRSEFFDKSLSDTWWRPENTHSGADGIKYRYKLMVDAILEPVPANRENSDDTPPAASPEQALAFSNMFRAFCNKGIFCANIVEFEILVNLADFYCALPAISDAIELALLKWLGCSKDRWQTNALKLATLAYRLCAKDLYHDVFVHLVGGIADKNHSFWKARKDLPQVVRLQVLEEYCGISQLKSEVDRELVRTHHTVDWSPPDEQKFYEEARGKFPSTKRAGGHHYIPPVRQAVDQLLQKNLKLGFPMTKVEYLLCAKLEKYPWEETDE